MSGAHRPPLPRSTSPGDGIERTGQAEAATGTSRGLLGRPASWCALIVGLEAVIILAVAGQGAVRILGGDSATYDLLGTNLAAHGAFSLAPAAPYYPYIARAPGYPAFLAAFYLIEPHARLAVRIAQFALLAVTAWLVYVTAFRSVGKRPAWIAAALSATFLPLLWFATQHMTEVLAAFGATLVVCLVVVATTQRRSSTWIWALVGLTLALSAFVRPEFAGLVVPLSIAALL